MNLIASFVSWSTDNPWAFIVIPAPFVFCFLWSLVVGAQFGMSKKEMATGIFFVAWAIATLVWIVIKF